MNPFLLTDAYKISHPEQYPDNTEYVYSNTTPRNSRMSGVDEVVVFGVQYLIRKYLIEEFNQHFFSRPLDEVIDELRTFFDDYFGPGKVDLTKYERLHALGYLPIRIKALPEGTRCPTGVPFMTVVNTHPEFYWVTNFIETLTQTVVWSPLTCATIADIYRKVLDGYAELTSDCPEFVPFQGHNFSMRGMSSIESGVTADAGHLLSFVGSDTLPGNVFVRKYYGATSDDGIVSCSVPATEHAVMCAGGDENERDTFRRLICDVHPSGIVSIVSDTWDLWKVLTEIAPSLRSEIESRDGKVVFRPDSGDPVKIVCGYFVKYGCEVPKSRDQLEQFWEDGYDAVCTPEGVYMDDRGRVLSENEVKGCVALLHEQFGAAKNSKGFYELNPKVGLIYGDSITIDRCKAICDQLMRKGYASTNLVYGIGSYTYQYNTRDTFSIACKATWVQINGVEHEIFKDPITDDGTKKSAKGLLCVYEEDGKLLLKDQATHEEEESSLLEDVFIDGAELNSHSLSEIRNRLSGSRVSDMTALK